MTEHNNKAVFDLAMQHLHADQPEKAAEICRARLLSSAPDLNLLTLQGVSLIDARKPSEAIAPLQSAVELAPRFARAQENLGHAYLMLNRLDEAHTHLKLAANLDPQSASTKQKLGHLLAAMGKGDEADAIFEQGFELDPQRGRLAEAGEHLREERFDECENLCKALLRENPSNVNAMRMLARVAGQAEHWKHAEKLLRRVLEIAPEFHDARLDLSRVLKNLDRIEEALDCTAHAVAEMPRNSYALYTHASILSLVNQAETALLFYRRAIQLREHQPAAWIGMGHLLKTLGRTEEGIEAYNKAIEQMPNFGEVYWSLANLKTYHFNDEQVADMERRLNEEDLDEDAQVHFLFTLGKAWEDRADWNKAFEYYEQACEIQRMRIAHDPVEAAVINDRICEVFTTGFLRARKDYGCVSETTPIFILGLPRSGSTLVEQILASHSQIEGTAELADIAKITASLSKRFARVNYPESASRLMPIDWQQLGETYLERTRRHRQGLPYFTDKMPNNFPSIGFILTILPNAKIIDARRHPLDSCFGSLKQHFAHGQSWSYDLMEIGEYYLEYRRLMRHWAEVLPGKVLEIRYEDMVNDQQQQARRLLEFCGLPWEDQCLRFYETERAVRTASSEQVRQPIYSSSVHHWKNFRVQLAPLLDVIGEDIKNEGWDLD
ncbi:MAG: sulfotransferase [Xanthomonadales bacterium]|nr:sulfotransferase [Xanthomonadales bacterium]